MPLEDGLVALGVELGLVLGLVLEGSLLVLVPLGVLVALLEMGFIVWRTRLVSLGSLMAAVTVPLVAAALYAAGWIGIEPLVGAAAIGVVVVVAHADNIARLRAGTERRLGSG